MRTHRRAGLAVAAVGLTVVASSVGAGQALAFDTSPRPEVQHVTLLTPSVDMGPRPAGSRAVFEFDEPIAAAPDLAPNRSMFLLYTSDGRRYTPDSVQVDGSTVTAQYDALDTQREADRVTVAATPEGAVHDQDGLTNPTMGDLAKRVDMTSVRPGRTGTPDLVRVGSVARTAKGTAVQLMLDDDGWRFDQAGSVFELRMTNGRLKHSLANRYTSRPDGHGGVRVTAHFHGHFGESRIARAALEAWTYTWTEPDAYDEFDVSYGNPYESIDVSNAGRTPFPDLEAVRLQHLRYPAVPTKAVFVFDQPVQRPRAARFALYKADGSSTSGVTARVSARNARRVVVTFPEDALNGAAGATVWPDAVLDGRRDGVGVAGTLTSGVYDRHGTPGPDLNGVYAYAKDRPEQIDFQFTGVVVNQPQAAAFHFYDADGTRVDPQQCSTVPTSTTWSSTVRCTFPAGSLSTSSEMRRASVDGGAVVDADGHSNPEGSGPVFY